MRTRHQRNGRQNWETLRKASQGGSVAGAKIVVQIRGQITGDGAGTIDQVSEAIAADRGRQIAARVRMSGVPIHVQKRGLYDPARSRFTRLGKKGSKGDITNMATMLVTDVSFEESRGVFCG